ncbi:MAG: fibrobacter succinogenes major paralogous domain-containing protein [Crocinitomicaceae bacterium]|nr:fibrobacter succinogenes major paralogous domain-containing protein [Crocinitomicaceae bacterium]
MMKFVRMGLLPGLFVLFATPLLSQGVKISTGGGVPDASSALEIESTTQGFLPPRMSTSERDAMVSPAEGLRIYNTTTKCENFFNGTSWREVCGGCIPQPDAALAGTDQLDINGTTATMAANTPSGGSGSWSIISGSGGSFSLTSDPAAVFTGVGGNSYTLRWTITTVCGSTQDDVSISFVAPFTCGFSTVSDADGNSYNTIDINGQCWFQSNLRTTKYRDNSTININSVKDYTGCGNFNFINFGRLYQFDVVENAVSACPDGWHIPTNAEWTQLISYVSNDGSRIVAGCSDNCTGFDAIVAGQYYSGHFEGCGSSDQRYFWTSSTTPSLGIMKQVGTAINNVNAPKTGYYYSVRCIKD